MSSGKKDEGKGFDIRNLRRGGGRDSKDKKLSANLTADDDDDFFGSDNVGSPGDLPPKINPKAQPKSSARKSDAGGNPKRSSDSKGPSVDKSGEDIDFEDELDRIEQLKRQVGRVLPLCQKGDYGALDHALRFLEKEGVSDIPDEPYLPMKDLADHVRHFIIPIYLPFPGDLNELCKRGLQNP